MKIGLVSDIKHAGILEELSLWVLGRTLKERGVLPVVLQAAGTDAEKKGCLSEFAAEQFTICAADAEALKSYGIFSQLQGYVTCDAAIYERLCSDENEEAEEQSVSRVPEEGSGDTGTAEESEEPEKTEAAPRAVKAKVLMEHPMVLGNQVSIHGISKKPEETEGYLFADIREMTEEKKRWLLEYAARRQLGKLVLFDGDTKQSQSLLSGNIDGVQICRLEQLTPEQYLGYVWLAAAVVTDCYCGTVLSMLHEKEFAVFLSKESAEAAKQQELLERLCLTAQIADAAKRSERDYTIDNSLEFRRALHTMRDALQERLVEELKLEEGEMLVKCPVRLPVSQCAGCEACEAVCPENAIHMEMDKKGFRYPVVDTIKCNECDWCTDVCIKKGRRQLVQYTEEKQPRIYVGEAKSEDGYMAYSGFFRALVRIIREEKDGVIFGSVLNKQLEPEIVETEIEADAMAFAEQRYLKSRSAAAFRRIRTLLEEDRFVLFAGLPCECAGLKGYLKRNYPKLFICEFLCHAVVSEKLFRKYIDFIAAREGVPVKGLRFGFFPAKSMQDTKVMQLELEGRETIRRRYSVSRYYQLLEQLIPIRESCAHCSYGPKKRVGDITLGELKHMGRGELPKAWQNYSIIMANTEKGGRILDRMAENMELVPIDHDTMYKYQYKKNVASGKEQAEFFRRLDKHSFGELIRKRS